MQVPYTAPVSPLKNYYDLVARRPLVRSKFASDLVRGDAITRMNRHNEVRYVEIVDAFVLKDGRSRYWRNVTLECEDIFTGSAYTPKSSTHTLDPYDKIEVSHVIYVALRVSRQLDRDMFLVQNIRDGRKYRITGLDSKSCELFENTLYKQRRSGRPRYMMWATVFRKTAYLGDDWPEEVVTRLLRLDEDGGSGYYPEPRA